MRAQTCDRYSEEDSERLALEHLYKSLDQSLGRPACDVDICSEMRITLNEFYQMLDRMKALNIGRFHKMASEINDRIDEPLITYIPDESKIDSSFVFRPSQIREALTKAIDTLPKMERLVISLYYYDELTLKEIQAVLRIDSTDISRLRTRAMLRLRSRLT
jgi:RNA polymerase sigma factor FliA